MKVFVLGVEAIGSYTYGCTWMLHQVGAIDMVTMTLTHGVAILVDLLRTDDC